mmetsp:Transcript_32265/g.82137  ORF Transcript_32265/g.82137 Transcript_32265/m.82137 type:complete len:559 (-) Transcript_32265:419-2095(-)
MTVCSKSFCCRAACCCGGCASLVGAVFTPSPDDLSTLEVTSEATSDGSASAPSFVSRRSTLTMRTSSCPSACRRAVASLQTFSASTSELAVMTCMRRSTSPCWPTAVSPLVCCPPMRAFVASINTLSSSCTSRQLTAMSLRSSVALAKMSARRLARVTSICVLSSARSSLPRLRTRCSSSVASRPSAAERLECRAPTSAWRWSAPCAAASSRTIRSPAPLFCESSISPRAPVLLPISSSSTPFSVASAFVMPLDRSSSASSVMAVCMFSAKSASVPRIFSMSCWRSLRSPFTKFSMSWMLIWNLSMSARRDSRSTSSFSTMPDIRISISWRSCCTPSDMVLSMTMASVTEICCRRSPTSCLRALHSDSSKTTSSRTVSPVPPPPPIAIAFCDLSSCSATWPMRRSMPTFRSEVSRPSRALHSKLSCSRRCKFSRMSCKESSMSLLAAKASAAVRTLLMSWLRSRRWPRRSSLSLPASPCQFARTSVSSCPLISRSRASSMRRWSTSADREDASACTVLDRSWIFDSATVTSFCTSLTAAAGTNSLPSLTGCVATVLEL